MGVHRAQSQLTLWPHRCRDMCNPLTKVSTASVAPRCILHPPPLLASSPQRGSAACSPLQSWSLRPVDRRGHLPAFSPPSRLELAPSSLPLPTGFGLLCIYLPDLVCFLFGLKMSLPRMRSSRKKGAWMDPHWVAGRSRHCIQSSLSLNRIHPWKIQDVLRRQCKIIISGAHGLVETAWSLESEVWGASPGLFLAVCPKGSQSLTSLRLSFSCDKQCQLHFFYKLLGDQEAPVVNCQVPYNWEVLCLYF